MIVYGRATSSNVQAVMWGAAELGLSVERRDFGGRFGGTDTDEYRALHPMGLVPALEDGEVQLFESAAILRYLVVRYGPGLEPKDDAWAEWAKHTLCAAFTMPVFWPFWRTPEEDRDMAQVIQALRRFEAHLGVVMNAFLCPQTAHPASRGAGYVDAGPWLGGLGPSLADIWVGHVLFRYFTLDLPREAPPGAEEYYDMLTLHPPYREHVMIDYSELKGRLPF